MDIRYSERKKGNEINELLKLKPYVNDYVVTNISSIVLDRHTQRQPFLRLVSTQNNHIDDIDLEFSSTMKTFDIYFDNFFTDYAVQKKVNAALRQSHSIYDEVERSLSSIKMLLPGVSEKLEIEETLLKNKIIDFK